MEYLESIASRYEGEAKVQRLQWIASRVGAPAPAPAAAAAAATSTSTRPADSAPAAVPGAVADNAADEGASVSIAAYRMLAEHFQRTGNTTRYKELFVHLNNLSSSSTAAAATSAFGTAAGAVGGGNGTAGEAGGSAPAPAPAPGAPNRLPIAIDPTWLSSQEQRNRQAREALAARLSQAQAHLHKDAIRAAFLALAEHEMVRGSGGSGGGTSSGAALGTSATGSAGGHLGTGSLSGSADLYEALHLAIRAKDYCVTRSHTATVSLQILELALAVSKYPTVREYVSKLENTIDSSRSNSTSATGANASAAAGGGSAGSAASANAAAAAAASIGPEVAHRVKIASALEALHDGDYVRAASVLMKMTIGRHPGSSAAAHGDGGEGSPRDGAHDAGGSTASWPSVLCGEEIALYTGLLALCALSRRDVLALAEHAEALELSPSVREALWQFHRGNYQASWSLLNWPQLALDYHLGRHIPALQGLVVKRAVLAYWNPCLRVDLPTMARDLEGLVPSPDVLLHHMAEAISQSHSSKGPSASASQQLLDTRIDLPNRVLVRDVVDDEVAAEHAARSKLDGLTRSVLDDSYSMIVRLACLEHKLVVQSSASKSAASAENEGRGGMYHRFRGSRDRPDRMGGGGGLGRAGARPGVRRPSPPRPYRPMGRPQFDGDDVVSSSSDDAGDNVAAVEGEFIPDDDDDDGGIIDAGIDDTEEHVMIDASDDMNPEDLY